MLQKAKVHRENFRVTSKIQNISLASLLLFTVKCADKTGFRRPVCMYYKQYNVLIFKVRVLYTIIKQFDLKISSYIHGIIIFNLGINEKPVKTE